MPPKPPAVSDEMVAKGSSQIATEAPKLAANRDALTPPLPAPIVKRSKSYFRGGSAPFVDSERIAVEKRRFRGEREWKFLEVTGLCEREKERK